MRVLIAGGKGQVGSEFDAVAKNLAKKGLDNRQTFEIFSFGSAELDITKPQSINTAVDRCKPHVIINAAAYTAVDKAEQESDIAYAINRDGVANLAKCCAALNIPLIHISTDYVFDGKSDQPYNETDTPNPQGVYGASKLAGELALAEQWHKYIIVRVSWVFGQHGNNFVKTMLRLAADRDELSVVADQWGAPTAARSIAENLLNCAKLCYQQHANKDQADNSEMSIPWGLYHLPSTPFTSWHGFAETIFDKAHKASYLEKVPSVKPISTSEYPTPAARPANSRLASNASKLFSECAWEKELDAVLHAIATKP